MNKITPPSESVTSFITAFSRSSNSPRNFAPAMRSPMSRLITRTPCSDAGTSPAMMRCAKPSMIAVLPTPGSPISTGLFLLRRDKICTVRRISSSRPTTGSSFPLRASFVKSRAYRSSDSYLLSAPWSVTFVPRRSLATAASSLRR